MTKSEEKNKVESLKEEDIKLNDEAADDKLKNKVESLKEEDIKLNDEVADDKLKIIEEKLLRLMAEMENQRRRFEKERQEAYEFGGFNLAKESLSILDNLDRAITSFKNDNVLKNSKDLDKFIEGINIVKKDLVVIFKKNNIEPIECINKKFDPNYQQAMLEVEDNTKETGIVVQEIQRGYMMGNRLLRPSLVGVSKKKREKDEKTNK